MSKQGNDGISWTDETWGPIRGCSKVSAGCANCYAESMAARFCGEGLPYHGLIRVGHWSGDVRFVAEKLDQPLRWKRPRRVFVNSMSDLFHHQVPVHAMDKILAVMLLSPRHTFQVLTKRPQAMLEYLTHPKRYQRVLDQADQIRISRPELCDVGISDPSKFPASWIHWGVSCENQATADERIPLLLQCPAAVRWVSAEPLLGAIDFGAEYLTTKLGAYPFPTLEREHRTKLIDLLDWVVCGGESGPHARPMHPDWVRSIRDQCKEAGVPFHFKQFGEWLPGGFYDGFTVPDCMGAAMNNPKNMHYFEPPLGKVWRVGKRQAGHLLDGREYRMWPGDKWQ